MLNSVPPPEQPRSCLAALRGALPALSRAERAVAEYILSHPGRVVSASVSDLAKSSGSAAGTVMRLCARLGFAGFPELKTALAVDLVQLGAPPSATLEPGQPPESVIRQVFELGAASLRETVHALDWQAAAAAGRALAAAARIDVYGVGGISGPLAEAARFRFLILGIPGSAEVHAASQLASAQTLRPGDAVLALSHSGIASPILNAVRAARDAGATVVAITNGHRSPLVEAADIALLTSAHEPAEWAEAPASRIPMFALFEALYAATALAREVGPPSERRK